MTEQPRTDAESPDVEPADDVDGHLYGEYYSPQVQGRWAGRKAGEPGLREGQQTRRVPRRGKEDGAR
jgi:hypothetical protein